MGPAVFAAEDCPLGERGQTVKSGGAAATDYCIGQDPVVEGYIDTVVIPVESHGFNINVNIEKFSTADPGAGGVIQQALRAFREIDPQIFNAIFIPAAICDLPCMNGQCFPQLLNIAVFALGALLLIFRLVSLSAGRILTSLFLLFMLPLSMNFIQFISKGISSGLTIYAYNLAYLLPLALIMHAPKAERPLLRRIRKLSGMGIYALLALFLALNIRTANVMAFKRDLEFSATTAAMARLLDEAERTEGYIPGETPVVLIGMLPSSMIVMERPGFEEIARAQGMRYTYGTSYETGNYWYLEMLLGEPINLVSHAERQRLSYHPDAASLAPYPHEGFCRMIDGHLFILIN